MSANPIENNATPKTTGSLEELFRHHLGEEAAVPPRPLLWDQIDNSLLIRQNESYRRRLAATRWVAAASLLLATLAGTGWWAGRTGLVSSPEMATTTARRPAPNDAPQNPGAARPGSGAAGNAGSMGSTAATNGAGASAAGAAQYSGNQADNDLRGASSQRAAARRNVASDGVPASQAVASARRIGGFGRGLNETAGATSAASGRFGRLSRNGAMGRAIGNQEAASASAAATETIAAVGATTNEGGALTPLTGATAEQRAQQTGSTSGMGNTSNATGAVAIRGTAPAGVGATLATGSAGTVALAPVATASVPAVALSASVAAAPAATLGAEEAGLLASRTVALGTVEMPVPALPGALAAGPEPANLALGTHRWQYGASYTASAFNPNINFSREGTEPEFAYNPILGPAELSEQAATEYRQNLRAGLSQRLALTVARRLRGHWSVGTGVELTKANAQSSSTVAFMGEQLADGGQTVGSGQRRTTDFSYTMAGLPLELRYSNPAKRGWSLYGRLGGVVTALLGNRSEVAGRPEITQTYSITSASTPYRLLTSSVRGAAGARFSAGAGRWALTLGPVAELGLVSLNAHPVQSYFAQSHPYSVGLEAGVEFGR